MSTNNLLCLYLLSSRQDSVIGRPCSCSRCAQTRRVEPSSTKVKCLSELSSHVARSQRKRKLKVPSSYAISTKVGKSKINSKAMPSKTF